MQEERTLVGLKKQQSPQVQMHAVFVAFISKFQDFKISAERKNKYISTEILFNPRYAVGQSDQPLSKLPDLPGPIRSAQLCNEQFDWLLRHS